MNFFVLSKALLLELKLLGIESIFPLRSGEVDISEALRPDVPRYYQASHVKVPTSGRQIELNYHLSLESTEVYDLAENEIPMILNVIATDEHVAMLLSEKGYTPVAH